MVGPDCYHRSLTKNTYYFLDNLVLAADADFDIKIRANDQPCSPNLAFEIANQSGYDYQWYKDGIAIIGATKPILNNPLGAGKYEVKVENERGCKVSAPYLHEPSFVYVQTTQNVCKGDVYLFDNRQLAEPGVYLDTLKNSQ